MTRLTRRAKILIAVAALAAVQAAAVAVYVAVERSRRAGPAGAPAAQPLADAAPAPVIAGERADGTPVTLGWPAPRARLVHFWATWCGPCRDELPALLAATGELAGRGVDVVAIAVDDEWRDIARFFAGAVPPEVIVERDGAAHKRFGVSTLPDSYLVDRTGKLVERYHGAQDWRAPAVRAHVAGRVR